MSFDPPSENEAWAVDQGFQFELWTDEARDLAIYYGAASSPTSFAASRITVLLDDSGAQLLEYTDAIDVGTHPDDVLADCQALFGP